jgi:hypothetical protein
VGPELLLGLSALTPRSVRVGRQDWKSVWIFQGRPQVTS